MGTAATAPRAGPAVSVVVVNHDAGPLLVRCLDSLARQTAVPREVVVVDSGSREPPRRETDGRPGVRLVALESNVGFAAAVNRGVEATSGELVALLNPDAFAADDWLEQLGAASAARPDAAWFASLVLADRDPPELDSAGHTLTLAARGLKLGEGSAPDGRDEPREVLGAPACASLYRREALERVGPFDESLFMVFEDVEWDLRAHGAGLTCLLVPRARVVHTCSAIRGRGSDLSVHLETRNSLVAVTRLVPASILLRMLVPTVLHLAWSFVVKTRRGQLRPFVRGLVEWAARIPSTIAMRRALAGRGRLPAAGRLLQLMDTAWHRDRARAVLARCVSGP